jgi:hypothetical protein
MNRTISATIAVVVGAGVLATAGSALAEGSWTSSISDASTGFDSRTWTDRDSDNVSTVIELRGCSVYGDNVADDWTRLQLTRETPPWQPDEDRGRKNFHCVDVATGNWGDVRSGDYHFSVITINGYDSGRRLSATAVKTSY